MLCYIIFHVFVFVHLRLVQRDIGEREVEVNDNAISRSSLELNDNMEEVRTDVMFNLSAFACCFLVQSLKPK